MTTGKDSRVRGFSFGCIALCGAILVMLAYARHFDAALGQTTKGADDHLHSARLVDSELGKPLFYDKINGLAVSIKTAGDGSVEKLIVATEKSGAVFEYSPHGPFGFPVARYDDSKELNEQGHVMWYDYNGDGVFDLRISMTENHLLGTSRGVEVLIDGTWRSGKLTDKGQDTAFVVGEGRYTGIMVESTRYIFDAKAGKWKPVGK